MIVFLGGLACLTFTMLVGWSWPTDRATNVVHAVLDGIGKSLWIGWALVVAAYFLGATGGAIVWAALAIAAVVAIRANTHRSLQADRADLAALATVAALVATFAFACLSFGLAGYTRIFHHWDALVSWNRWAIELHQNDYRPYGAAYPLLFPGLWSLVYRLQDSADVWFVAKLSVFVFPGLLLLATSMLWSFGRPWAAALCAVITASLAWRQIGSSTVSMLSGYMDSPVAVLMLVAAVLSVLVIDAVDAGDQARASSLLETMAVFSGLAAITKQAGVMSLAAFTILLVLLLVHRKIEAPRAVFLVVVASLPLIAFSAVFASVGGKPVSTLATMRDLAERGAGGAGTIPHAFDLLFRSGRGLFVLLAILAPLNFMWSRTLRGQFGLVLLAVAVAGFFIFAECCSYEPRNGWWILSLLAASALLAFTSFAPPRRTHDRGMAMPALPALTAMVMTAVAASALAGAVIGDQSAMALQRREQWALAPTEVVKLVRPIIGELGPNDIIVSRVQAVRWLPGMEDRFASCKRQALSCIANRLAPRGQAFILTTSQPATDYPELEPLLTTPALVGTSKGFSLFGPYPRSKFDLRGGRLSAQRTANPSP